MEAGKKLIIIESSFKFLINDLFNEHVMFDTSPVETIKGILRSNKFISKLFTDMVQEKFIEILGYNPGISFFILLRYWIRSKENYIKFSKKVNNKWLSRDVHNILERITMKGSFFYFKHCLLGIERSMQTKKDWIKTKCRINFLYLDYGYGYRGKEHYMLKKFRRKLLKANRVEKSKQKCEKMIKELNKTIKSFPSHTYNK
ncbi:14776_t:CDS:1 [Dentiscutata erythropus]|uniref:14776_t:CDS:1 n=1 Tax=Dentiscutata erythropus TaxID=1348616 RepID=A0A9N9NHE8_9GLOM|nr:14776_t:CDS:1 [Dentiscutata erythropus]